MSNELVQILESIRIWSIIDYKCRGDTLKIAGTLSYPWKCEGQCGVCPLLQVRHPNAYSDQIIQTFSQLNK